jgi:F-type H+-transporting ATPase subunit epsilon
MNLKVLLPSRVFLDEQVHKVVAEGGNGYFCLLPRHIDFVTALVPGILSYESESGEEVFIAVDNGVLVKYGQVVLVSSRNAVRGPNLEELWQTVQGEFMAMDEQQRVTQSVVAKIEAQFIRRFLEVHE